MIINSNTAGANVFTGTIAPRTKTHSKNSAAVTDADQTQTTAVSSQNLTAAGAPIMDEDAASNMTETLRQMIIAQNTMAMTGQANALPQGALRLLQQQ